MNNSKGNWRPPCELKIKARFGKAFWKKLSAFALCFTVGGGVGAFFMRTLLEKQVEASFLKIHPVYEKNSPYKYINPLLACSVPNSKEFFASSPLEKKVNDLIAKEKDGGQVKSVAMYYRDLAYGRWVGINETDKYDPASMLKVVIMIAYYKQAENDPNILDKYIVYTKKLADTIHDVQFQTPSVLKVGESYTIAQLVKAMIVDSDNGAKNALLANIDEKSLDETYSDLGITENPDNVPGSYTISSKTYSLFFRILYNATYLSREMSEKALGLLSKAAYKDGIVAGIPKGVSVSQKFGEHVDSSDTEGITYELHDCGIVYKPDKPYLLCVMTKGTVLESLTKTIQDISKLIYIEN